MNITNKGFGLLFVENVNHLSHSKWQVEEKSLEVGKVPHTLIPQSKRGKLSEMQGTPSCLSDFFHTYRVREISHFIRIVWSGFSYLSLH